MNVPCMLAVAEGDVVDGGVDELVLQTLAISLTHLREAEGLEHFCVSVDGLVVVRRVCCRGKESALRNECPVDESDILHCLPSNRR